MWMQSSGHTVSHRWHAMHSSSPFSGWKRRRGTPRKRGDSSTLSLGYSTVMCGRNWFLSVTHSPTQSSSRRNVLRNSLRPPVARASLGRVTALIVPPSSSPGEDQDPEPRADHVDDRQGDEPLPPEGHELIVAVARVGPPEPDVHEQEERHL